jgi:hypothetical protein
VLPLTSKLTAPAVTVVVPSLNPAAIPFASITATDGSRLLQDTAAIASKIPFTGTGVEELPLMGSSPQHSGVLSESSAQAWWFPARTATAVSIPLTRTGVLELPGMPFPSWPLTLAPQQFTRPSARRAQA